MNHNFAVHEFQNKKQGWVFHRQVHWKQMLALFLAWFWTNFFMPSSITSLWFFNFNAVFVEISIQAIQQSKCCFACQQQEMSAKILATLNMLQKQKFDWHILRSEKKFDELQINSAIAKNVGMTMSAMFAIFIQITTICSFAGRKRMFHSCWTCCGHKRVQQKKMNYPSRNPKKASTLDSDKTATKAILDIHSLKVRQITMQARNRSGFWMRKHVASNCWAIFFTIERKY